MRFAAALFLLLAAIPAAAQREQPANSILLVAKPSLTDPSFRETVVLVTQTPDATTVGVILNRPAEKRHERTGEPLYSGGPVMPQVTIALFAADREPTAAFHVLQGIYLSMHPANVDALPSRPGQRLRFFTGFAGWAPNQLQRELKLDAWFVLPVTEEILFRTDTSGLWKELFEKARGSRAENKNGDRLRS
ncbi:MAG TPA: YqgE/AlgH family protein [Burkholderiales bacterium]|nr:YqgE/AlgH family protein [Burkholderiales bacterium]